MICYKKQKRHRHHGNVFCLNVLRLNAFMLINTAFIHDTNVSNRYCAALSNVVGAGVDAGVGVALTGTAKYF